MISSCGNHYLSINTPLPIACKGGTIFTTYTHTHTYTLLLFYTISATLRDSNLIVGVFSPGTPSGVVLQEIQWLAGEPELRMEQRHWNQFDTLGWSYLTRPPMSSKFDYNIELTISRFKINSLYLTIPPMSSKIYFANFD